ncbi:hypothetical protein [Micromonospora vulcania]|uniref:Uncharacterized protein n=1 Tax=Micromonospora vulcania TaxID=1441873 RepID=A0ABW1H382_9ACTN
MTADVWLFKDGDFAPGAELLRSEREFQLWSYSVSHSQLLLRANRMPQGDQLPTTIEVLFKPVKAVQIQEAYLGLVIRCATEEESARILDGVSDYGYRSHEARVLLLESEGATGYVVTSAVGWREGVMSPVQASFFNSVHPDWPVEPLAGVHDGSRIASPQEAVEAFLTGLPEGERRERYRYVYLVWAVTHENDLRRRHNFGVFLTEADAEEAVRLVTPHVESCYAEPLPMVL